MEICFGSNKLKKQLGGASEIKKEFGRMAKTVSLRMVQMRAAETLDVLMKVPGPACHQLSGNRSHEWAVTISGNHRMIFIINHEPEPLNPDGSINTTEVTSITITGTEDYH